MNREVIFRGKLSHSGEWVFGSLLKIDRDYHIVTESDMCEDGHHIRQESDTPTWVDPETIGQFTGLRDKNGKDIYEGDIVKCGDFVYRVVYEGKRMASFALHRKEDVFLHYFGEAIEAEDCEVIGNIHNTPELLKKE